MDAPHEQAAPGADAAAVTLRFIGSGDAFGSGGRLQTCLLVDAPGVRFLIDCGCSSMIGLCAQHIDPDSIDAIVLTHFHGDHCGGVAFLLFHAMAVSRRTRPLTIAGPVGTRAHVDRLMSVLFPGSEGLKARFQLDYLELVPGSVTHTGPLQIQAWPAVHTAQTRPMIVRVGVAGRHIVYTGDTAWTPDLIEACDSADLLVTECYYYDTSSRWHLDHGTLLSHREQLTARRIVLTHPSDAVLARAADLSETLAHDGLIIAV
jgi:ribonuclease BN (tRNA processing enzyme)